MDKWLSLLLMVASTAFVACGVSRVFGAPAAPPAPAATASSAPAALSREEQIQVLLFQRLLDTPSREEAVTKDGKPIYLAISADLRGPGAEPKDPSDAVIAALGPRPFPMQKVSQYLKTSKDHVLGTGSVNVYWVGPMKWVDENTVETSSGHHFGPKAADGAPWRLRWKDGQWQVESMPGGWKS